MSRIAKLRAPDSSGSSPSGRPLSPPGRGDRTKTTAQRPSKLETTTNSAKQTRATSSLTKMSQKFSRMGKSSSDHSSKGYSSSKDTSSKKTSGNYPARSPPAGTKSSGGSRIPGLSQVTASSSKPKPKSYWRKSDSAESNLDTSPEFDCTAGIVYSNSKLVVSGYETASSDLFSSEADMVATDSDAGGAEGVRLSGSPSADSGCDTLGRGGLDDLGGDDHPQVRFYNSCTCQVCYEHVFQQLFPGRCHAVCNAHGIIR